MDPLAFLYISRNWKGQNRNVKTELKKELKVKISLSKNTLMSKRKKISCLEHPAKILPFQFRTFHILKIRLRQSKSAKQQKSKCSKKPNNNFCLFSQK